MSLPREPSPTTGRSRRRRQRTRRRLVGGAALVVSVAAVAAALGGGSDETRPRLVARPDPTTTTTTTPSEDVGPFTIAASSVPLLNVYPAPAATGRPIVTLGSESTYGLPTTVAVDMGQISPSPDWVPVVVPIKKPNETTGWVQASQVVLSQTSYLIRVSLGEHRLTLLDAGEEVLASTVIIGTPQTPTPLGRFYVTDPVNCNEVAVPGYPVAQCGRTYGAFALGLSGLSEALDSFNGGIPQIALHGTDLYFTELGKDLSNGCIRMPNDVVRTLAETVPLGTPVVITA